VGDAPTEWVRARWPSLAVAAGLVFLVGWAFWQRYAFLVDSPYPLGIDGYFYPIQLRSLLEEGSLYYPSAPLTLWFMAPFAAATDPISGAKIGAALGSAIAVVPIYLLGRRLSGDRVLGLLAAALVATSVESAYLTVEFVKNGIAMAVGAAYLCALAWALDRPSRARVGVAVCGFIAALLAHKLVAVFCVVATAPPLLAWARASGWRPNLRERSTRAAAIATVAVLVGLVTIGALAPERFAAGADLQLLSGLFSSDADWTLPALDLGDGHSLRFGYEVALAGALALLAIAAWLASRRCAWMRSPEVAAHDRALVLGPALFALVAALPWIDISDPQGLGFRLRLIAFVPLALCAAAVAAAALGRLPGAFRAALVVGFAVGWIASRPAVTDEGVVEVAPHMQAAVLAADGVVPADHVIVCPERHIMFMVTWYTRAHARLRPESVPEERRWRLLPSAHMSPALHRAIDRARSDPPPGIPRPRGLHPRHRNGVVLMPEATWQWILRQLPAKQRAHYEKWKTI